MVKLKLYKKYQNEYAVIYISDRIKLLNNNYLIVFIATLEGVIYDTIILNDNKYYLDNNTFLIYHINSDPEQFKSVPF